MKVLKILKKITAFVSRYMAAIVILVAALALFAPSSVSFLKTSYVNPLLGIVMFGMGLTLKPGDFKVVFSRPKDVIIGCIAQFTVMPLLAFLLTKVFNLSPELAIGVILVGTCPGGTSSNVMTYLSKGDVALSVGMTACSTILAPILTPALTYVYAGQTVDVNVWSMFLSIVQVVILPIILGFLINHFFKKFTEAVVEILPLISTLAIVAIVAAVVSTNSANLMTSGALIIIVVILHNVLGYLLGYVIGKVLKLDETKVDSADGEDVYVWTAIVDGKVTTVETKENTWSVGDFYESYSVDSDGYYEAGDDFDGNSSKTDDKAEYSLNSLSYSSGTLTINGSTYVTLSDTQIVLVMAPKGSSDLTDIMKDADADYEVRTPSGSALANLFKGYTIEGKAYITYADDKADTDLATVLYIEVTGATEVAD